MLCVTIRTLRLVLFLSSEKYYTVYNSGLKIWLVLGKSSMAQLFNLKFWLYLWRLGVGFRHIFKPQNVKCNIFSELTQKASLLFFRKKINENCNRKILRDNGKLKPNFVLKILFGKILCEIKNWNQTLRDKSSLRDIWNRKPNFVDKRCVEFFSSWKYNTAFNSGLKIWRVSGKSEMARLFNLKFFLYLCWFGFGSSPHFQAAKR